MRKIEHRIIVKNMVTDDSIGGKEDIEYLRQQEHDNAVIFRAGCIGFCVAFVLAIVFFGIIFWMLLKAQGVI